MSGHDTLDGTTGGLEAGQDVAALSTLLDVPAGVEGGDASWNGMVRCESSGYGEM